jgi:ferredoxin-NADP reductase
MVKSIIRKIWNETPDVKIFILELEKNIPFKSGQFVMLKIDKEKFNKIIPSRAYSIANSPNEKHEIKIIAKIIPDSAFSQFLDKLNEHDELEVLGPYGRFSLKENEAKSITLIGAGTGIAPLIGMMEFALENNIKVDLFYCDKTEKDLIHKKEIEELLNSKKIKGKIIVTRETSSYSGRINSDFLKSNIGSSDKYFICGPPNFVNEVTKNLEKQGISEEDIKTERYG